MIRHVHAADKQSQGERGVCAAAAEQQQQQQQLYDIKELPLQLHDCQRRTYLLANTMGVDWELIAGVRKILGKAGVVESGFGVVLTFRQFMSPT